MNNITKIFYSCFFIKQLLRIPLYMPKKELPVMNKPGSQTKLVYKKNLLVQNKPRVRTTLPLIHWDVFIP